jgi:hypothetical protein
MLINTDNSKPLPTVATSTNFQQCEHKNGWYSGISFFTWNYTVFACSDCGEILKGRRLKQLKEKHRVINDT